MDRRVRVWRGLLDGEHCQMVVGLVTWLGLKTSCAWKQSAVCEKESRSRSTGSSLENPSCCWMHETKLPSLGAREEKKQGAQETCEVKITSAKKQTESTDQPVGITVKRWSGTTDHGWQEPASSGHWPRCPRTCNGCARCYQGTALTAQCWLLRL
jgi:hypothetical protein